MEPEIRHRIKQIRTTKGLSQRALGELIGSNRDDIKDIENGRKRCFAGTFLRILALVEPEQVRGLVCPERT